VIFSEVKGDNEIKTSTTIVTSLRHFEFCWLNVSFCSKTWHLKMFWHLYYTGDMMEDVNHLLNIALYDSNEEKREATATELISRFSGQGIYHVFVNISESNKLPASIKEDAKNRIETEGMIAVEKETTPNYLIHIAGDKKLPCSVREAAGLKAVDKAYIFDLISFAENNKKLLRSVREAAGLKTVEILAANEESTTLVNICQNKKILVKVREAAGLKAVEMVSTETLTRIVGDRGFPKAVREAAAAKRPYHLRLIDTVKDERLPHKLRESIGITAVEALASGMQYEDLHEITREKTLPATTRKVAGVSAVELIGNKELYHRLLEIAREEGLPMVVRETAGKKAVEMCVFKGWPGELRSLKVDSRLPLKIRKICEAGDEVATMQAIKLGKPPLGVGLYLTGTVKPPKRKKDGKEIKKTDRGKNII